MKIILFFFITSHMMNEVSEFFDNMDENVDLGLAIFELYIGNAMSNGRVKKE